MNLSAYLGYKFHVKEIGYRFQNHESLAFLTFLYGCEIWTVRQDGNRLRVSEMKFLRQTPVYCLLDHHRNEVLEELRMDFW